MTMIGRGVDSRNRAGVRLDFQLNCVQPNLAQLDFAHGILQSEYWLPREEIACPD